MADRAELPIPTLPSRDVPMAVAPGRDFAVANPLGLPAVPGNFIGGGGGDGAGLGAIPPVTPDVIANYLTYTGGQWPHAGIPGVPAPLIGPAEQFPGQQSFSQQPSGHFVANPPDKGPPPGEPETGIKPDSPWGNPAESPWGDPSTPSTVAGSSPWGDPGEAPVVPGQLIGGMAPEMWLKKYRGEA